MADTKVRKTAVWAVAALGTILNSASVNIHMLAFQPLWLGQSEENGWADPRCLPNKLDFG
ncbi:hypothetical protein Cflav_PD5508 [Pedosphaera parvula Ellin514]|uniref:Uncharacterized protein n=1 Tax=Pedosphaera parvula (strain Ellin514) TaxID=320771 RepID=B9XBI8_PEDPL|nr:hypothetical protein Cflav_PD5508 [Pedosphaera parvula Ellin514]